MKDEQPNTGAGIHTQWSDSEIEKMRELAVRKPRKAQLIETFPGRTLGAIRLKLSHLRRELGVPKRGATEDHRFLHRLPMLDPDDEGVACISWQEQMRPRAERANAAFLAALERIAA